jgi:hypothetical protein
MPDFLADAQNEADRWRETARALAYWLERHVDPPNGSPGCPEHCDARKVLARYRKEEKT